jgi:hypothetical protein
MILVGGLWGLWGAWQAKDSGEQATVAGFAWYALVAGAVLGAGLVGWLRWRSPNLVGRRVLVGALVLIGLLAAIRVVQAPWTVLVLGPLLLVAVWALRRLPRGLPIVIIEPAPTTEAVVTGTVAMVGGAVVAYALAHGTNIPDSYGPAVYIVTTATGFVLLVRAIWVATTRPRARQSVTP